MIGRVAIRMIAIFAVKLFTCWLTLAFRIDAAVIYMRRSASAQNNIRTADELPLVSYGVQAKKPAYAVFVRFDFAGQ